MVTHAGKDAYLVVQSRGCWGRMDEGHHHYVEGVLGASGQGDVDVDGRYLTGQAGVGDRQTHARSVVPDSPLNLGLFSDRFYYLYGMEGRLTIRWLCSS